MRHLEFLAVFSLFIFFGGCQLEQLDVSDDPGLVVFTSTDTLVFDTLLTERLSITKRLKIYNPNEKAIEIDRIGLGGGNSSPYDLVLNGREEKEILDEVVFGKDSLLILVNVNIENQNESLPFLVKDSIEIWWNGHEENVKLISWGQDAHYLGKGTICDARLTADRPYVFYDTVLVENNCELIIDPGAKLYFDKHAALLVAGRLTAVGDSSNQIVFRNSRFDQHYENAPGQWAGINFIVGSGPSTIEFATVENAISCVTIGTPDDDEIPDLQISNSTIRNASQFGIAAFTSDIEGENLLIYNAGNSTVFNVAGGNYDYRYCTFANQPSDFFQDNPSVIFSSYLEIGESNVIEEPLNINLSNSIIWGNTNSELLIASLSGQPVNAEVLNNIIKSEDEWENNLTSLEDNYPGFMDIENYDYRLESGSICIDIGSEEILIDLEGNLRDQSPDVGAFEFLDQ